jgi:hypothetical protein
MIAGKLQHAATCGLLGGKESFSKIYNEIKGDPTQIHLAQTLVQILQDW